MLVALAAAGCAPGTVGDRPFDVREITPPFLIAREARDPTLVADARGTVALSWIAHDSTGTHVWLAVSLDSGATFSSPARITDAGGRATSFPEGRPAIALGPGGAIAIAWSEHRADTSGAVDLRARSSGDFGRTFGPTATINDDVAGPPPGLTWRQLLYWPRDHRGNPYHGLPALAFLPDGSLLATWLDDRNSPGPDPARLSWLWRAFSMDGGRSWGANYEVTRSACPCCRPALATTADGEVAIAYRDGSNDLRDPRLALSHDGGRLIACDTLVSRDRWQLAGCPDEGAALVWDEPEGGHYLWYTGAQPAGVYAVRWQREGGFAGMRRAIADTLRDATHPVAVPLGERLLVGLNARAPGDPRRRTLAVRTLERDGSWSAWTFLGADATSGMVATAGARRAIACWVEREPRHDRLRLAALTRRSGARL